MLYIALHWNTRQIEIINHFVPAGQTVGNILNEWACDSLIHSYIFLVIFLIFSFWHRIHSGTSLTQRRANKKLNHKNVLKV